MHLFMITKGKVLDFLFHMSGYRERKSHLQVAYIRTARREIAPLSTQHRSSGLYTCSSALPRDFRSSPFCFETRSREVTYTILELIVVLLQAPECRHYQGLCRQAWLPQEFTIQLPLMSC